MHLSLPLLTTSIALASAQYTYNNTTFTFTCPSTPANAAYCTGPSLTSNIIIRCTSTKGVPGNCNDNLAGVPPLGVKDFAPCYQTSLTSGDAACSYAGTVYPDHAPSFPVPANTSTSTTTPSTAKSSPPTAKSSLPAVLVHADFANQAPYPISNHSATAIAAATGTATVVASGDPPSNTGGSGTAFTGGAGGLEAHMAAVLAVNVAVWGRSCFS